MFNITEEASYPTPYANSPLLPLLLLSLAIQKNAPDTTDNFEDSYDYIVIGAGTGGSTVAGRLSENPCVKVLVLEAGKSPPTLTDIPAISRAYVGSDIDWAYLTTPQKNTGNSLINNQLAFPSGKAIGGSSIINAMLYVRGARQIYDKWAAQGATGWSYEDVLPYFKKSEMNENPEDIEISYHGFHGPATVTTPPFETVIKSAGQAALSDQGYPPNDPNGEHEIGAYKYQSNTRIGQRCSAAKAYLVPADNRTNIDIVKNAFVTQIIIENKRAVGVQFDYGGETYNISATREVIVSAGTVNTAQILMLSGIGPKEHLQEIGIPLVMDLPVGQNFHDHCAAFLNYYSDELSPILAQFSDPTNVQTYIVNKTGVLTTSEGVGYMAFLTNDLNETDQGVPDYELYFSEIAAFIPKVQFNLKPEVYKQVFEPYENKSIIWCTSSILHPKSRGFVKLRSANPYDSPIIEPNYLDDEQDLTDIVSGLKECELILDSEHFKKLGIKRFETVYPGCEDVAHDQDAYLACQTKSIVMTLSHQVSTARMGDPGDNTTVVDPELRVKGIQGLRVVDASIMPIVPSGNTNNPTMMVGEKAADMIKQDIKC